MKQLGNLSRGLLFILSAPAGTGKTTLTRMLTQEFSCIWESISFTTRKPRETEQEGVDYFFTTPQEFQKKIDAGDFLEHATVFGHSYGTSSSLVELELSRGRHVILVIDTQGATQLKNKVDGIFIFITPPSLDELRLRLAKRRTESEEVMAHRLTWAGHELEQIRFYDYHIINEELQTTYQVLRSILIAEEHRIR